MLIARIAHHAQEQRRANMRAARFDRRRQKMTPCFFKTTGVGCFNLETGREISAGSLCVEPKQSAER